MSAKFTKEIKPEILSKEPVNINFARFVDRLEPEHEQAWEELIALGEGTAMTVEDMMTPVWREEALPQVFRDRAMLVVVATADARQALGQETYRTNGAFAFGSLTVGTYEKVVDSFDPESFCKWVREAWEYQQEVGRPIISDQRYLSWNYEFFERGLINESELNDFISKINIAASSPTWEGSGWVDDIQPLDQNRFPLLSDIFNGRTVSKNSTEVLSWAQDRLGDWLSYKKNETVDIPEWLKAVSENTGRALFKELVNEGNKPDWLSWDFVRAATDYFGLDIFHRFSRGFDLLTVHKVEDRQFKEELLKVILSEQNAKANIAKKYCPLTGISYSVGTVENVRSIDIMQEVVQDTHDLELKDLFELELKHAAEYKERSWLDAEKRKRESAAKREASPQYQEQQRARNVFFGKIAHLAMKNN